MKAYPLVWNSREKYKNHIIMIGTLWYTLSHYGLLQDDWEKTAGTGFSDAFLEVGMITTGSMTEVMNGKKL